MCHLLLFFTISHKSVKNRRTTAIKVSKVIYGQFPIDWCPQKIGGTNTRKVIAVSNRVYMVSTWDFSACTINRVKNGVVSYLSRSSTRWPRVDQASNLFSEVSANVFARLKTRTCVEKGEDTSAHAVSACGTKWVQNSVFSYLFRSFHALRMRRPSFKHLLWGQDKRF